MTFPPPTCRKHGLIPHDPPCPHCREDEKVLEERLDAATEAVYALANALDKQRLDYEVDIPAAKLALRDALRSLVREVRR